MEKISFVFDPVQNFSCRDCASRCCKNWTVDISSSDVERFQAKEWVQERILESGASFIRLGENHFLLPVVEIDRQIQCLFLEPDGLCGLHRRYGHEFLASSCQTFPFDFIEDGEGKVVVVTSRVCPSIRENYGNPIAAMVQEKFVQSGGKAKKQSPFMFLGQKTRLTCQQYSTVFNRWEKMLSSEPSLILALALCHRLLGNLAERWADRTEVDDLEVEAAISEEEANLEMIREEIVREVELAGQDKHHIVNVILTIACLPLTYPFRSRVLFRGLAKATYLVGVLRTLVALFRLKGTIDAIFLGSAIPLSPDLRAEKVLGQKEQENLREYLLNVLARRKFAMDPKTLETILFTLITVPATYAFYAKLSAAGKGVSRPIPDDFREAVSALEMSVLHQTSFMGRSRLFQSLLPILLANPRTVFRILNAEIGLSATVSK